MQRIVTSVFILLFASQVFAVEKTVNTAKIAPETLRHIVSVANKYQAAITCNSPNEPASVNELDGGILDVIQVEPLNPNGSEGLFYVIWVGDIGCGGGSGSDDLYLTTVKNGRYPYVEVTESSPVITFDGSGAQQASVTLKSADVMEITGLEHQDGDASCCPTKKIKKTLKRDQKGNWRMQR